MRAVDLLKRMADAYASARTYADQGGVGVVQGRRAELAAYATWFARPDRFRMDYRDQPDPSAPRPTSSWTVWRTRGLTRRLAHEKVQLEASLTMAMGRVEGTSHGVASAIPSMLLPGEFRLAAPLSRLEGAVDKGPTALGGALCHRIDGRRDGAEISLFLETETLLVRGFIERRGDTQYRITCHPRRDMPIEASVFEIALPGAKPR